MSTTVEYLQLLEIDVRDRILAVTFTANGEHLVIGGEQYVQVWGVKDGKQVAVMSAGMPLLFATCVAASMDGRYIAGGSLGGRVLVWETTTYESVLAGEIGSSPVRDVHFSPDSTCLVSADSRAHTATIWDIAARRKVRTLDHSDERVSAAKYSPRGDLVATATEESVRVWDSNDGRLLVDVQLASALCLLWCSNHLFVLLNDGTIKQINAATGSTVSQWPVPRHHLTCYDIALPHHGKFIAHLADNTITFWNTSTQSQLGYIQHTSAASSIACFSGHLLAIASGVKVVVKHLSRLVWEPELHIDSAALDAWKRGQLVNAEALLSAAIPASRNNVHYTLASRSIVRARLQQWDSALVDADNSIENRRSLVGYIAKCMALVGKGEKDKGLQVCDTAFLYFHSEHASLLLLIKAVVLFMAGEHIDAISRMDILIAHTDVGVDPALNVIQAYMHLLHGKKHIESGNYEGAIQSFEDARIKLRNGTHQPPLIISLISGWRIDDVAVSIEQCLGEVLLAAGRLKEAGERVLRMSD